MMNKSEGTQQHSSDQSTTISLLQLTIVLNRPTHLVLCVFGSVNFGSVAVKHANVLYWPREVKFLTRGRTAPSEGICGLAEVMPRPHSFSKSLPACVRREPLPFPSTEHNFWEITCWNLEGKEASLDRA